MSTSASDAASPRVLLVLSRFRPMVGRAERQCELLIEHLATRVDWVDVLTHRYDDQLPPHERGDPVDIHRLGRAGAKGASPLSFYLALARAIVARRHQFDVVHCHTAGMTGIVVAILARCLRRPVLLKLTAAEELRQQVKPSRLGHGLAARAKHFVRRLMGGLAAGGPTTHVVGLTLAAGDEARDCGVRHVHVIPNGVEASRYQGLRRAPRQDDLHFGYCGRLTQEKGTHVLAEAFASLLPERTQVSFSVAGSGNRQLASSEELLRALQDRYPDRVQLLGLVDDTRTLLRNIDVYVSASTYEGLPNAVLEAVACGLPCVLSDIDAHREMQRLNPEAQIRLFTPDDPRACQEAIEQVIQDWPLPGSRLSMALQMDQVANRYLDLYRLMCSKTGRSVA